MITDKPNANTAQLGMWNKEVASDPKKVKTFNREPIEVTRDQMRHLYLLAYPFIASEFVHRDDMFNYIKTMVSQFQDKVDSLNKQIETLVNELNTHTHIGNLGYPTGPSTVPSTSPGSPYTNPQLELWSTRPEDKEYKVGESFISAGDNITTLTKRDPNSKSSNIVNQLDSNQILKLISGGDILPPFDTDPNSLATPDKISNITT